MVINALGNNTACALHAGLLVFEPMHVTHVPHGMARPPFHPSMPFVARGAFSRATTITKECQK